MPERMAKYTNIIIDNCGMFFIFILLVMLSLCCSWAVSIFHCPGNTYKSLWTFSEKSFSSQWSQIYCASLCAIWPISTFGHARDWHLRLFLDSLASSFSSLGRKLPTKIHLLRSCISDYHFTYTTNLFYAKPSKSWLYFTVVCPLMLYTSIKWY